MQQRPLFSGLKDNVWFNQDSNGEDEDSGKYHKHLWRAAAVDTMDTGVVGIGYRAVIVSDLTICLLTAKRTKEVFIGTQKPTAVLSSAAGLAVFSLFR